MKDEGMLGTSSVGGRSGGVVVDGPVTPHAVVNK